MIHAAGTEALAAGATPHGVLRVCERISAEVPVVLMVYVNLVLSAGPRRSRCAPRRPARRA